MNASAGSLQAVIDEGTVEVVSTSSAELTAYHPARLSCANDRHDIWGETKAESIEVLSDGDFVVVGYAHRCPKVVDFEIDGWIARFDTDGAMLWSRSYNIWDQTWARAIALHPDGGFVVTGGVALDARELMNNTDIALWRIDGDGQLVWSRVLEKPASEDKVNDILALEGGDVVLAGFVAPENAPDNRSGYCTNEYAYSADNGTNSIGGTAMGSIFGVGRNLPCVGFVARFDGEGVLV